MKRKMLQISIAVALLACYSAADDGAAGIGDELDDILGVEEMQEDFIKAEVISARKDMKNPPPVVFALQEKIEGSRGTKAKVPGLEKVRENPVQKNRIKVEASEARRDMENPPVLASDLHKRTEELRRANAEVERLKDFIVRIRAAAGAARKDIKKPAPSIIAPQEKQENPPANVSDLHKKTEELRRAKAEEDRLKDIIVKIRDASRREKAIMKKLEEQRQAETKALKEQHQVETKNLVVEKERETRLKVEAISVRAEQDEPAMVLALQNKTEELIREKAEVDRLKGIVVNIREVSRHEKAIMYYNMGCIYKTGRLYEKAKDAFLKALENNPRDSAIHYNIAIIYDDDLNDKQNARKHYEKFLELAPDDADAPKVIEWLASLKPVPKGL